MMHLPHRISGEIAAHLKIAATVTFLQLGILEFRREGRRMDGRTANVFAL